APSNPGKTAKPCASRPALIAGQSNAETRLAMAVLAPVTGPARLSLGVFKPARVTILFPSYAALACDRTVDTLAPGAHPGTPLLPAKLSNGRGERNEGSKQRNRREI